MHSWWSAPLGNVRVLLVCFAGTAFSSLETWPVSELKVASGKSKRKHCSKRISQEQDEKENTKKSRPFKEMPYRRAPVFLLSPGINTLGRTLPPCWIYSMSRGLVSTNQTFFASEMEQCPVRYTQGRLATLVPTVVHTEGGWGGGGWNLFPEFLICCSILKRFYFYWKAFDLLTKMSYIFWVVTLLATCDVTNNGRSLGRLLSKNWKSG